MSDSRPLLDLLHHLWKNFPSRRRKQFGFLLVLMIFTSFAELFSIGAALPFLIALTAPEKIFNNSNFEPIIEYFGFTQPQQIILPITFAFGVAAILAGGMRLSLLKVNTKFSFATGADLSINIYRRTLYQPYLVHCSRNSSEVIDGIYNKTSATIAIITNLLTFLSSSIMLIFILIGLLFVEPRIAISSFLGFAFVYGIYILLTRKQLSINSLSIAQDSTRVIKYLQEGLGGIRDVLIDGTQEIYCRFYRDADVQLRRAQGSSFFISASPRYVMEALGMLLIAVLALFLAEQKDGISNAIPILGIVVLSAQRLLPILQQIYSSFVAIKTNQIALQDTLILLDQSLPCYVNQPSISPALLFENSIGLNKISFRYSPENPWIFRDLSLTIKKGSRVGFIGTTGSGKSTLIDIIMGLLQPTSGFFEVDGRPIELNNQRNWQNLIAHVPQTIFLSDTTIAENIAFGVPKHKIDLSKVKLAAQQAHLSETIEGWDRQYQTIVGERGIRLSGGQRQRIGIARALYKKAEIIVLDEATSALDDETELLVIDAIKNLSPNLTFLIIAHRISSLKDCTEIIELGNEKIIWIGKYDELIFRLNNLN